MPSPKGSCRFGDMKRTLLLLLLLCAGFVLATASQQPAKRKVACKTPENTKSCYWAHGRLSLYNGTPSLRLWKVGTNRILGIYSGPGAGPFDDGLPGDDDADVELPAILMRHDFTKQSVYGDFEVCPLAPEIEGHMQPACIESAKKLVFERSNF